MRGSWAMQGMLASADHALLTAIDATVELRVDSETMWLHAGDDGVDLRFGPAPLKPSLTVECDVDTFVALCAGSPPDTAVADGTLALDGDRAVLDRFLRAFTSS
ncbi:SCP2 sterol-binding domain-containing protein [Umezawaea sp. Da 62-37]|uniref:SCP2 sterol-binding domain-containing protein n=1 Tax=Umezawaea sp. Da 62-37 TaxID=3075927 RepID=UPI0028F74D82|nr:SCP2 sterol-binding domain-containing protein [Umezawaea sp. Da 62-37]WNV85585.1 SCP2 sterol-binding domain-containing protein [Umezawaea sp. Da 62-37]